MLGLNGVVLAVLLSTVFGQRHVLPQQSQSGPMTGNLPPPRISAPSPGQEILAWYQTPGGQQLGGPLPLGHKTPPRRLPPSSSYGSSPGLRLPPGQISPLDQQAQPARQAPPAQQAPPARQAQPVQQGVVVYGYPPGLRSPKDNPSQEGFKGGFGAIPGRNVPQMQQTLQGQKHLTNVGQGQRSPQRQAPQDGYLGQGKSYQPGLRSPPRRHVPPEQQVVQGAGNQGGRRPQRSPTAQEVPRQSGLLEYVDFPPGWRLPKMQPTPPPGDKGKTMRFDTGVTPVYPPGWRLSKTQPTPPAGSGQLRSLELHESHGFPPGMRSPKKEPTPPAGMKEPDQQGPPDRRLSQSKRKPLSEDAPTALVH